MEGSLLIFLLNQQRKRKENEEGLKKPRMSWNNRWGAKRGSKQSGEGWNGCPSPRDVPPDPVYSTPDAAGNISRIQRQDVAPGPRLLDTLQRFKGLAGDKLFWE